MEKGIKMKKLLLTITLLLGMLAFGEKITTGNMTWTKLQAPELNEEYSGTWMGKKEIEMEKFSFTIDKNDKNVWILNQLYEDRKSAGGDSVEEYLSDDDTVMGYTGSYIIHSAGKKGIYYVNNFVDLKGKKYKRLYFGFDEKLKTVVITDKDGNILEKLKLYLAG